MIKQLIALTFGGVLGALTFVPVVVHAAPPPALRESVAVCDPNAPTHCTAPNSSGAVPVTISGSTGSSTVAIDQTTPGTTNGVQVNAPLPAGTNVIGHTITDSGSTSAATQSTASNLNAQVVGNIASGSSDSGNPIKVGCVFNSTLPTFTTGQRGDCQLDSRGNIRSLFTGGVVSGADGVANSSGLIEPFSSTSTGGSAPLWGVTSIFNGSTWDRTFTCPNSAAVNVTAANTTQIVGLSGTTVIRVCSIAFSMSAAGTAGVYTGTGTNCGTGTTALIQDMTLATGTPFTLSAPTGGSIVRSSAGGEICVKAVTGNVTGVITYAQF